MVLLSLTREEAAARSALLTVDRYDIDVDMSGLLEGSRFASTSTIAFRCTEPGATTFVDIAAQVTSATLNGVALDVAGAVDGRLPLPDLQGENILQVSAWTENTAAGEGILRTVDPTDGLVYVWTSLETDEARRLWACFDQPDLKAPHRFTVLAPESWLVTSNGAPEQVVEAPAVDGVAVRAWHYPDTPALSTYVVVVNAGPFHEVRRSIPGHDLGFYCRQSLRPHLERDLEELVTLTHQGLDFFGEQFGMAFPQERYDQVFVPNLGGAMENWGCITYGDSQLFRTPPTHAERAVRAEFVLHEMAHQWFGDLVTMQWWDDLWLNEAFASWAANWGMARATAFTDQWASFLAQYKRGAYEMDLGPGTHPIRSEVPDVLHAMANFDHITYMKGQSVLHQLMAFIGEPAFVAGLQRYFAEHAWGNTVLKDLMDSFAAAAGTELDEWTTAWLDRAGPDELALDTPGAGAATLRATSPDDQGPRPHQLDIASFSLDADTGAVAPLGRTSVRVAGDSTPLDLPTADVHLVNSGDLTYAVVRADRDQRAAMFTALPALPDPLDRALVVSTGVQALLLGEAAPREVSAAISRALASEASAALVEPFLNQGLLVSERWAAAQEQPELLSALGDAALTLSANPEHRAPALRALAAVASTPEHWAALEEAIGQESDLSLAWAAQIRRAELNGVDHAALEALMAADPDPDAGTTKRLKVLAAAPEEEAKEEVWRAFFVDRTVPASRDALVLGSTFWRVQQGDLLRPYTFRYLEELTRLGGGLLGQGVVIRGMFPQGVGDEQFLEAALTAADGTAISAYAANQVKAGCSTLARMHTARHL